MRFLTSFVKTGKIRPSLPAISKTGNGERRNGERGTGNGESLKGGISKIGNL